MKGLQICNPVRWLHVKLQSLRTTSASQRCTPSGGVGSIQGVAAKNEDSYKIQTGTYRTDSILTGYSGEIIPAHTDDIKLIRDTLH